MKPVGAWLWAGVLGLAHGLASTDTITWGGDNSRTGYETNHNMDPSVVGSKQFAQIFKAKLPGNYGGAPEQIFSQPLVYTPSNGTTQYVYWATTQNNLYKMDAKTGTIVAQRNLHIPFLTADLDGCVDINPNIGVTATGVIDPDTDTLYLTAKTYVDQNTPNTAQGRDAGRYYVHAINVNDLSERPNFPVDLQDITATNNPKRIFTGGIHHQRPGLLHVGDYIYAGFASHCVQYDFSGWIIGWHKSTGKIVESWATEGADVPITTRGGGVWMSGGGLASDNAGSVFFATGNGYASQLADIPVKGFQPPTAQEESAVHMTLQSDGRLKIVDFFMPWEKQELDGADKDLGTSPLELLPPQFACGDIKRVGVVTGKSGKTYWLNMDNLGGYRNGPNHGDAVIQVFQNDNSVYAGAGVYPLEGGYIYINVIQHPSNIFKYSCVNGVLSFPRVATTAETNAYILGVSHGSTTSLNGNPGTGLFWVTDVQGPGLRIYNAVPEGNTMKMINSFDIPGVNKFTRPVFGDGIVYVGTNQGFVYAYGSPVASPLNCTSPTDFGSRNVKSPSDAKEVACTALIDVSVSGLESADADNFKLSSPPNVPFNVVKGSTFTVEVIFDPSKVGLVSSDLIVNTTNSIDGYSTSTHARLVGTGESSGPLLDVSPDTVEFESIVAGQDPNGVTQQFLISNLGNSELNIQKVLYSTNSSTAPSTWNGQGDLVVDKFRVQNIPTKIDGQKSSSVTVLFDSSQSGSYYANLKFVSDGGSKSVVIKASSGPAAKAVFDFQSIDGNSWVPYVPGKPFDFGNVTENESRALRFRITNGAASGGVSLSLTVSKPPFGVSGLIKAANQVDLAEGTSLAPGESGTAVLSCSAPKTQWNTDPVNGTAGWTINTNDPVMGKQRFEWVCNAVAPQAPPLLGNGQGRYRYKGCFLENNPGRQLQTQLYGDDTNTNGKCIAACAAGKYAYCGTQYHRECWAGNQIPTKQVDERNCNFDCSGDLNQICGGNGDGTASYISLFMDSETTDTGPPPTGPGVNPGVDGYTSMGCYTEADNSRALPVGVSTASRTVAECIKSCKSQSFEYAGVEYGGECWCGGAFSSGSVPAPIADCNMPCNDNGTEYCGGPSRLNVYRRDGGTNTKVLSSTTELPLTASSSMTESPSMTDPSSTASPSITDPSSITSPSVTDPSSVVTSTTSDEAQPTEPSRKKRVNGVFSRQGCWTEATNMRALSDKTYADDKMTLESCGTFCADSMYFGVEYGRECYCGNSLNEGSVEAKDEDCSFPCPGDALEYCGAGNRLELYKKSSATETSETPTGTTLSSPSLASTVSLSTSFTLSARSETPTTTATPSSTSAKSSSSLSSFDSVTMSETESITATTSSETESGMTLTATQTTETESGTTLTATQITESTTTNPSKTSDEVTSTLTQTTVVTPTGPVIHEGNANHTYYGCYAEPICGRLLQSQEYYSDEMTVDMCLQKCSGMTYAGVQYGKECWCGMELTFYGQDSSAEYPGRKASPSECNFACAGNKTEYCGASRRMNLYVRRGTPPVAEPTMPE